MKLTELSKASGCGCKLAPAMLKALLEGLTTGHSYPQLMVGNHTADDASVYKINDALALIQTVDFFTPLVDDPEQFGKIGAANALSDVYAMGGRPVMANVVLGFPPDAVPLEIIRAILQGAADVCAAAGIPMAGGHTIQNSELIFGLSVTGMAHPQAIKTNAGATAGDYLLLTKPLGTGMLGAAVKRAMATPGETALLAAHCSKLNSVGAELGNIKGVHAMTDVTGFGLYGHLLEMCNGAKLSAVLHFDTIPLLDAAKPYAAKFVLPDNTFRNWNAVKDFVQNPSGAGFAFLNDPQTNGGLLIAVAPDALEEVQAVIQAHDAAYTTTVIGCFTPAEQGSLITVQ